MPRRSFTSSTFLQCSTAGSRPRPLAIALRTEWATPVVTGMDIAALEIGRISDLHVFRDNGPIRY
jgi:hypothetical protein